MTTTTTTTAVSEAANTLRRSTSTSAHNNNNNAGSLLQNHVGHANEMMLNNADVEKTLMAMATRIKGLSRPDPALVREAHLAIARIDADLSLRLTTCLPAFVMSTDDSQHNSSGTTRGSIPDPAHHHHHHHHHHQEEGQYIAATALLRKEAEEAKRSHQTIIALHELHQISEKLMAANQEQVKKMMKKKNVPKITNINNVLQSSSVREECMMNGVGRSGQAVPGQTNHIGGDKLISEEEYGVVGSIILKGAEYCEENETKKKLDLSGHDLQHLNNNKNMDILSSLIMNGRNMDYFSSLVYLDLSQNLLKELPESIAYLRNLEKLDLHSNRLSKLPHTLSSLCRLRTLNLSGNMLTSLPDSIGECRALRELNLAFNQLETLPLAMGYGLTSLRVLSLHSNKLSFITPSICHLMQLKVLDLHFNKLQTLPSNIGNLGNLEKLYLNDNSSDFGGGLPRSIGKLAYLVELDLSSNQIKILPDSIGALSKLKILKVDNNPLVIPPMKVVEHSMEAMLEYLRVRWISSHEELTHTSSSSTKQLGRSKSSSVHATTPSWLTSFIGSNPCKCVKYATPVSSIRRIIIDRPHRSFSISHEI